MPKKTRSIRFEGDKAYVTLTRGYEAIIDAADAHLVESSNWCAAVRQHTVYAERAKCYGITLMHRVIANAPAHLEVDHKSGNGLINTRENLRVATRSENARNTVTSITNKSGVKGVSWDKTRSKWTAHIQINKKCIGIGRYDTVEMASIAYAKASAELHGEFGRLK